MKKLLFIALCSIASSHGMFMRRAPQTVHSCLLPNKLHQMPYRNFFFKKQNIAAMAQPDTAIAPDPSIVVKCEEPSYIHLPQKLAKKGITQIQGKFPKKVLNLIQFIRFREKYERMGARFPTGLLLIGKPGTGKTLVGRAIAEELGKPFCYASASDFQSKYYGKSEENVRDFFKKVRSEAAWHGSSIAFIDEIEALGARNQMQGENSLTERRVLAAFMTELDGRKYKESEYYIFGATNDVKSVDPALKRPGRFDRIIEIPLPDKESREAILRYYAQAIRYHKEQVDFEELANVTNNCTPADLKHLVNEAALRAVRKDDDHVTMDHLLGALQNLHKKRGLENKDYIFNND